ncbi:MAG: DHH family phosphoesterase, partial [Fibrobacterota bacterium]
YTDPSCSATAEIVHRLFSGAGYKPSYEAALGIYVGILTDTGSFRYENTTPSAIRICADMIEKFNLPVKDIYKNIYLSNKFAKIKAEGLVLSSAELHFGGKVCIAGISRSQLESTGAQNGDLEGVVDYISSIKELEVGILSKYTDTESRFSLRSNGSADVGKVAQIFGGGGHRAASGCTIPKPFSAASALLLEQVGKCL